MRFPSGIIFPSTVAVPIEASGKFELSQTSRLFFSAFHYTLLFFRIGLGFHSRLSSQLKSYLQKLFEVA